MNAAAAPFKYDIAVIGGGLVGLTFVRHLVESRLGSKDMLRIALLEQHAPRAEPRGADLLRVSALAPVAQEILLQAHIWQSLNTDEYCPFTNMHVWHSGDAGGQDHAIHFSAADMGAAALGFIVRNHALQSAAWQSLGDIAGIDLITGDAPTSLANISGGWSVVTASGLAVNARLLVAADGSRSWVRDALRMESTRVEHGQRAIVAEIATELPHEQTARQRFLPGGPVALLPLSNGNSSLVWSCPDAQANELLASDAASFACSLEGATGRVLGELTCVSERLSFALASAHAPRYVARRCALLGDAAHQVHPLAGQGLNLGLLDAAILAENLATHLELRAADPGDRMILRRYERARKGDNLLTQNVLMRLNQLFGSNLASAGGIGLGLLDRARPVKRLLAEYAMGGFRKAPVAPRSKPRH